MLKFTESSINCEREDFDPSRVFRRDYSPTTSQSSVIVKEIAKEILAEVMQYRRFSGPKNSCACSLCSKCIEPHLSKIISAVALGLPVTFILPAFPGKSPNPDKVFGPLPDMAERLALEFLQRLCGPSLMGF